jgi:hypothetical protein
MRSEAEIRERIADLEARYDAHDPPASPAEEEAEIAVLRAIEELEWALGEREADGSFTK